MAQRPHTGTLTVLRVTEVVLNLVMRGCWSGLEQISKLRAELDIPEFHDAIRSLDLKTVAILAGRLAKAGHNPLHIFHIAARGVPDLTSAAWHAMLLEAHKTFPETLKR